MKKLALIIRAIIFTMIASLLCPISTVFAIDENENTVNSSGRDNYDIIFVLDGSGSMKYSDPDKYTSKVVELFLNLCDYDTCRAGYVVYSHNIVSKHELVEISSPERRKEITEGINSIEYDPNGDTDIALGLTAAMQMQEASIDSSDTRKPFIVLLSDGNTDLPKGPRTVEVSEAERLATSKRLGELGIPTFTIGLNCNKNNPDVPENMKLNFSVMEEIALESGAVKKVDGQEIVGSYEITDASQLRSTVVDIFSQMGKIDMKNLEPNDEGEWISYSFDVKNNSVFFANIYIETKSKLSDIKLYDPRDKEVALSDSASLRYIKRDTYSLIKLFSPEVGPWKLKVKGVNKSDITVSYLQTYDLYASQTPNNNKVIHIGDSIVFNSSLNDENGIVTDIDLINAIKGELIIEKDGSEYQKIPFISNEDGTFDITYQFSEEGSYLVTTHISANDGSFLKESNYAYVIVENAFSQGSVIQSLSDTSITANTGDVNIVSFLQYRHSTITDMSILRDCKAKVVIKKDDDSEEIITQAELNDDGSFSATFTPTESGKYTIFTIITDNSSKTELSSSRETLTVAKGEITINKGAKVSVKSAPFSTEARIKVSDFCTWDSNEYLTITLPERQSDNYIITIAESNGEQFIIVKGMKPCHEKYDVILSYNGDDETRLSIDITVDDSKPFIIKTFIIIIIFLIVIYVLYRLFRPKFKDAAIDFSILIPQTLLNEIAQPVHFTLDLPVNGHKSNLYQLLIKDSRHQSTLEAINKLRLSQLLKKIDLIAKRHDNVCVTVKASSSDPATVNGIQIDKKNSTDIGSDSLREWYVDYNYNDVRGGRIKLTYK